MDVEERSAEVEAHRRWFEPQAPLIDVFICTYNEDLELLRTTAEGWGETSLATVENVRKDGQDLAGPVSLGVAVAGCSGSASPDAAPHQRPSAVAE